MYTSSVSSSDRSPRIRSIRQYEPSLIGARLSGRYEIQSLIGAGGMGTVFAAVDLKTDARVALKALNQQRLTTENLRRFRREAQAALAARHPNLCKVYGFGSHKGVPYLVMECLQGETLRNRIRRAGVLSPADAVAIGIKLLDALTAVHAAKILHRDVKPGNVFITTPVGALPEIKLIDFGLARFLPTVDGENTAITMTGVIPGTPAYLSPEQVVGARDLDERIDVWGVGLTMFELLAGRHGYEVATREALLHEILFTQVQPIRAIRPDVPPAVEAVLMKALAKRRQERYASARAFRDDLVHAWARHRFDGVQRGALVAAGIGADDDRSGAIRLLE